MPHRNDDSQVLDVIADVDLKDLFLGELGLQHGFGFLEEEVVQDVVQEGVGTELAQDAFGDQLGILVGAGQYQDAVDVGGEEIGREVAPVDEVGVGEVRRAGIEVHVEGLLREGLEDARECGRCDAADDLAAEVLEDVKVVQEAVGDGVDGAGNLAAHALPGFVEIVAFEVLVGAEVKEEGTGLVVGFVHDLFGRPLLVCNAELVQCRADSPDERLFVQVLFPVLARGVY